MRYILRLSGEHPMLPLAELSGVLDGEGLEYSLSELGEGLILAEVDSDDSGFVQRLALTTKACEFVGRSVDLNGLANLVFKRIRDAASFVVRAKSETLEKKFGTLLHEKGLNVDLENFEVEVNLFKCGREYLACLNIPLNRDFNSRRPHYRPFFSPTSMHPKIARAMVNLAKVAAGDTVLDPFCGTGGILIEAGLVGMKLAGWDISDKMVSGCRQNLLHYGLKGDIREQDALNYNGNLLVDAIVTDPPYGRASYTSNREVGKLYAGFLEKSLRLVKNEGHFVMMLPNTQKINPKGFLVEGQYDIKVHKSLTRRIWVLKKSTYSTLMSESHSDSRIYGSPQATVCVRAMARSQYASL